MKDKPFGTPAMRNFKGEVSSGDAPGLGWEISPETIKKIEEIEHNISRAWAMRHQIWFD